MSFILLSCRMEYTFSARMIGRLWLYLEDLRCTSIDEIKSLMPLFSLAMVLRTGVSCSLFFICEARFRAVTNASLPSRSDLFTTKTSAISMMPLFNACISSPLSGTVTTTVVSAMPAISTSLCPTPTVSTII